MDLFLGGPPEQKSDIATIYRKEGVMVDLNRELTIKDKYEKVLYKGHLKNPLIIIINIRYFYIYTP